MKVKKKYKILSQPRETTLQSRGNKPIKLENETFVTTDKEILSECETFSKNLYSSNNGSQNERADKVFFKTQMETRLDQTKQDTCEGLLTKLECLEALIVKNMECNKTPGSDGLPAEF